MTSDEDIVMYFALVYTFPHLQPVKNLDFVCFSMNCLLGCGFSAQDIRRWKRGGKSITIIILHGSCFFF